MKKVVVVFVVLVLLFAGLFGLRAYQQGRAAQDAGVVETLVLERGDLLVTVSADGFVRSNQLAVLTWKASGTVGDQGIEVGDRVARGQVLAELDPDSLPPAVILAQVQLIEAQRALDDLLLSQSQSARAWQALQEAEQALEEGRDPQQAQAQALQRLAEAKETAESAQRRLEITRNSASQSAIDQTYANLVMAENTVNRTKEDIARIEKKLNRPEKNYAFWEDKGTYRKILKSLNIKLAGDQVAYQEALEKYNRLLQPPDPNDVAQAEAELALAVAELSAAQQEYERVKDGVSEADLALLEAKVNDARREYERVRDGPDEGDILAAQAKVAAAQAAIDSVRITAHFEGVITAVFSQPGDQVTPGLQAFRLDDLSSRLVDVNVSEIDINKIQLGQPVQLSFEAVTPAILRDYQAQSQPTQKAEGSQTLFQGTVVAASVAGEEQEGVTFYSVTVELDDPGELVKPGMSAQASFVTNNLKEVLLIPNRALRFQDGQRVVYIMQDGIPTPVPVTLGASSAEYSQLVDGELGPGDEILILVSE